MDHRTELIFQLNGLMVAYLTSKQQASVSQGRICSDMCKCCHTEIKLYISPSHSILTPGQPIPALILERQAPGRVAKGVPVCESLLTQSGKKSRGKRDSNPGAAALEADALTTRLARRFN